MTNSGLDRALSAHLIVEFGAHGERAVEYLRTAERMLSSSADMSSPRHAECVAYCLREALKTIPASYGGLGGGEWSIRSRKVLEAKQRFAQVRGVPGADEAGALRELLVSIDDLARIFEQESIHQKRLIAVMVERTGAEPLASGTRPVDAYQDLLTRLDRAIHTGASLTAVADFWAEALTRLRQLFLPPDARHQELAGLAMLRGPVEADAAILESLLAAPGHLEYFLARVDDPGWLDLLDASGLLEPADGQGAWPAHAAVERLRGQHAGRLSALLAVMLSRWGADPGKAFAVARAALLLGVDGQDVVLRAAKLHPSSPALSWAAVEAARTADPASEFVQQVADMVLSGMSQPGYRASLKPLLDTYVAGVTAANLADRIRILCFKLRKVPPADHHRRELAIVRYGSIADLPAFGENDLFPSLVRALTEAICRASEFTGAEALLNAVSQVPDDLRGRVRSWILATWGGAEPGILIDEVTQAIGTRRPTGDDLRLVDMAVQSCQLGDYATEWAAALGSPPAVADAGTALANRQVPEPWMRAFYWTVLLPAPVITAWASVTALLAAAYGQPCRDALEQRPRVWAYWSRTPYAEGELRAMAPDEAARMIAAWRPNPGKPQAGSRELARTLESVVKSAPTPWAATPLRTGTLLREPVYLSHYMRGIAEAESLDGVPPGELADLILLAFAHPWQPTAMGDPTYDYDPDWRETETAALDLIIALARQDLGLAGREDAIWGLLEHQVRDRSKATSAPGMDTRTQALSRPCTCALQAMLDLMGYEHRRDGTVRDAALNLLTATLAVSGLDGEHYRAIIAPRIAFVRHVAPRWAEEHRDRLFRGGAPGSLGQMAIDLALAYGLPDPWLLEHFRGQVQDAVRRAMDNALDHYLVAMLRAVPGYNVDDAVTFLRSLGKLSDAGQALGRLLGSSETAAGHVVLAAQFWEKAIDISRDIPESLTGFGWYANIPGLDDVTWNRLTRQTLTVTRGRIDWAHRVADRAAHQQPSPDTLEIHSQLLRGLSDYWEQRLVLDIATTAIKKATDRQTDTAEYERLRTVLLERGVNLTSPVPGGDTNPSEQQGKPHERDDSKNS